MVKKVYTANDGLRILQYIGIKNLTQNEIKIFQDRWDDIYKKQKDPIKTTWVLYEDEIPYSNCEDLRKARVTKNFRYTNFTKKFKEKADSLAKILKKGTLKDIIELTEDSFKDATAS